MIRRKVVIHQKRATATNYYRRPDMPTGSIISFKEDKGYGFIKPKDGGDNVYVHISALQASGIDKVAPGQRLTYEIFSKDNKISAVNIKLLT